MSCDKGPLAGVAHDSFSEVVHFLLFTASCTVRFGPVFTPVVGEQRAENGRSIGWKEIEYI